MSNLVPESECEKYEAVSVGNLFSVTLFHQVHCANVLKSLRIFTA